MLKKTALTIMLALGCSSAAQAQISYLQDTRDALVFPDYTYDEKVVVAEQAKLLLDGLYVHKYAKNLYYGISPTGHLDPVDAINSVIDELGSLSSEEFHKKIQKIFLSQRDLHLNYNYPAPLSNYISFVPFKFAQTIAEDGSVEVRVNDIWSRFLALIPEGDKIALGDKVVSYNGRDIDEVVKDNFENGAGANPDGGYVRALEVLSLRSHSSSLVPQSNELTLSLESHETGEVYNVTLPWLVYNSAPSAASEQNQANIYAQSTNDVFARIQALEAEADIDDNFALAQNPTFEPTITWNKVNVDGQSVGYIRIASFIPQTGTEGAINAVVQTLDNQLSDTDALVIDVRDNPGGNILYADALMQLFAPQKATPTRFRLTNTPLNQYMMLENQFGMYFDEHWRKVVSDAADTNAQYTATTTFVTKDENNQVGQAYYKPVGVWSNAKTYSSGDVFTCGMQDNGFATIFGQHKRTGAGGANVLEQDVFATYVGAPFEKLPHGQGMRVSWRQMVRHGHNVNSLIEDYGCVADQVISYDLQDILNGDGEDFATISKALLSQRTKPASVSFEQPRHVALADINNTFTVKIKNTELVDVYVNDQKIDRVAVYAYGQTATTLDFVIPEGVTSGSVKFVGLDSGKTPLWNSKRYFY